jgi:hypothetical protein
MEGKGVVSGASDTATRPLRFMALLPFLLISFGLAWGILALFIFLPEPMAAIFGELTGLRPF